DAAGRKRLAAQSSGRLLKDEVVVVGVKDLAVEAKIAQPAPEAELRAVGGFDFQRGVADVEGAARVMRAIGEELERARRPLDTLHCGTSDHPGRQVLEHLETDAGGGETEGLRDKHRIIRGGPQGR